MKVVVRRKYSLSSSNLELTKAPLTLPKIPLNLLIRLVLVKERKLHLNPKKNRKIKQPQTTLRKM